MEGDPSREGVLNNDDSRGVGRVERIGLYTGEDDSSHGDSGVAARERGRDAVGVQEYCCCLRRYEGDAGEEPAPEVILM